MCELDTVEAALAEIHDRHEPAEVLVYNGARWHERPAMTLDPMDFTWDLSLCATGALVCAQHVYPGMQAAGRGTILFTGGGFALHPEFGAGNASLTAGKSAICGLTYAMAAELAPENLHVATVTISGTIKPGTAFDPDLIAQQYWILHQQPRAASEIEAVFTG
jgi:NAD(P)-dependent dehydrogenase (short-subunit alcohol dehydrogenase family)